MTIKKEGSWDECCAEVERLAKEQKPQILLWLITEPLQPFPLELLDKLAELRDAQPCPIDICIERMPRPYQFEVSFAFKPE